MIFVQGSNIKNFGLIKKIKLFFPTKLSFLVCLIVFFFHFHCFIKANDDIEAISKIEKKDKDKDIELSEDFNNLKKQQIFFVNKFHENLKKLEKEYNIINIFNDPIKYAFLNVKKAINFLENYEKILNSMSKELSDLNIYCLQYIKYLKKNKNYRNQKRLLDNKEIHFGLKFLITNKYTPLYLKRMETLKKFFIFIEICKKRGTIIESTSEHFIFNNMKDNTEYLKLLTDFIDILKKIEDFDKEINQLSTGSSR